MTHADSRSIDARVRILGCDPKEPRSARQAPWRLTVALALSCTLGISTAIGLSQTGYFHTSQHPPEVEIEAKTTAESQAGAPTSITVESSPLTLERIGLPTAVGRESGMTAATSSEDSKRADSYGPNTSGDSPGYVTSPTDGSSMNASPRTTQPSWKISPRSIAPSETTPPRVGPELPADPTEPLPQE